MMREQSPSNSAAHFFVVRPTCAQKKVTRHSHVDLVEKEEKYEYEAFVTDPCACGMGIAEITSDVEERKLQSRLLSRPTGRKAPLDRESQRDAVGKEEKNEH
jgi:hypothetical protein